VVASALKPGPDGSLILRVYEATGQPAKAVRISLQPGFASVSEANLMEDSIRRVGLEGNVLAFDLGAHEIKTFRLELGQAGRDH